MRRQIIESYLLLLQVELVMAFRTFQRLHRQMQEAKGKTPRRIPRVSTNDLCHAMDLACILYPKRVLCLQRSAATALLLRRHGVHAEMLIGAQKMPFKSHAWVEVDGAVVNDKPYMREMYQVLERC